VKGRDEKGKGIWEATAEARPEEPRGEELFVANVKSKRDKSRRLQALANTLEVGRTLELGRWGKSGRFCVKSTGRGMQLCGQPRVVTKQQKGKIGELIE